MAMQSGDDPGNYTVVQVNEYLKTASQEEIDRVLAAEAAGENRSSVRAPTVVSAPEPEPEPEQEEEPVTEEEPEQQPVEEEGEESPDLVGEGSVPIPPLSEGAAEPADGSESEQQQQEIDDLEAEIKAEREANEAAADEAIEQANQERAEAEGDNSGVVEGGGVWSGSAEAPEDPVERIERTPVEGGFEAPETHDNAEYNAVMRTVADKVE